MDQESANRGRIAGEATDAKPSPSGRFTHVGSSLSSVAIPMLILVWLGLIVAGQSWMLAYETTPGRSSTLSSQWPSASRIEPHPDQPTLVVFAHPRCPCTRATIGELSRIMAQCYGYVDTHVVFFKPKESAADWEKTDIYRAAANIPGVTVVGDIDGEEAKRFAATTSGFAMLFDLGGQLRFSGGITPSRGHQGDNLGRRAIETLVLDGTATDAQSSVFGCPLLPPQPQHLAGEGPPCP